MGQLLETPLLNLVNYPSLIATNAARMRHAAGPDKVLLEFGLRRAQGPDGGLSAAKYAYLGGFNATSNVLAGKLFDIGVRGTHAHAFVMSYTGLGDLDTHQLRTTGGEDVDFVSLVLAHRSRLQYTMTNDGELAAFIAYAQAFPHNFLALIDTYDSLNSGVRNFIIVGLALADCGYKPIGVRLDSGDLAYISKQVRLLFYKADNNFSLNGPVALFSKCMIVASNDIDEEVLLSLNRLPVPLAPISSPGKLPAPSQSYQPPLRPHEIDVFGIGTKLVTCASDPALGCVYKLVEINGQPRIKVSQELEKIVIPSRKDVFRLYGKEGYPLLDLMVPSDSAESSLLLSVNSHSTDDSVVSKGASKREPIAIHAKHPFKEGVEARVLPSRVLSLLSVVFDGSLLKRDDGGASLKVLLTPHINLETARDRCIRQLQELREDHIRPVNPTPYKISVSPSLYDEIRRLLQKERKETILS